MSYRFARKDANHDEVVLAFKALGFTVQETHMHRGLGFDCIVSKGRQVLFIEIKDGTKPPSARKLEASELWAQASYPNNWKQITSVDEVIKVARWLGINAN